LQRKPEVRKYPRRSGVAFDLAFVAAGSVSSNRAGVMLGFDIVAASFSWAPLIFLRAAQQLSPQQLRNRSPKNKS
jgi:hypothetical protein